MSWSSWLHHSRAEASGAVTSHHHSLVVKWPGVWGQQQVSMFTSFCGGLNVGWLGLSPGCCQDCWLQAVSAQQACQTSGELLPVQNYKGSLSLVPVLLGRCPESFCPRWCVALCCCRPAIELICGPAWPRTVNAGGAQCVQHKLVTGATTSSTKASL